MIEMLERRVLLSGTVRDNGARMGYFIGGTVWEESITSSDRSQDPREPSGWDRLERLAGAIRSP